MDRRQNFRDTLAHRKPSEMIIDLGGNPLSSMEGKSEANLLEFLGYGKRPPEEIRRFGKSCRIDERILKYFNIDTRSTGEILVPGGLHHTSISPSDYVDEWGIRRRFTGMYWEAVNAPLEGASIEELDRYPFPDPDSIDYERVRMHAARAKYLYEETDYIICAEHPVYGVFELGCWMCGFEDFLYRMAMDERFVQHFFERVLEYQKKVIEIYYGALGAYIHYTSSGDDFATQNAPFISPEMFTELVKPYLQERIRYTKTFTNAAFLHHSCGSVYPLIEDLIDAGVDILNPIQPKAIGMSSERLKNEFGKRIVFHGGIDTQELLPFGTEEEIEESVFHTIRVLNRDGGYVFAAAHNIQPDVEPRKLTAMLEAANRYRTA